MADVHEGARLISTLGGILIASAALVLLNDLFSPLWVAVAGLFLVVVGWALHRTGTTGLPEEGVE